MQTQRVKIVVIGNKSVGKTSFLNALVSNNSQSDSDEYKPFDNVSTMNVEIIDNDVRYDFELWDTKSVDYYKIIGGMQNDDFSVVLICYSVMELQTFQDVKKKWIPMVRKSSLNSHVMIVGMKCDLRDDKVSLLRLDRLQNLKPITVEEGYLFARNNNAYFHECSAVSKIGISDIFHKIIQIPREPPEAEKCSCIIL